jgi:16S rRNA (uracil1498-N3)-methyltransferase
VGIDELSFLNCQFSERRQLKTERIGKIVVAAVKQSHKAYLPTVNELVAFSEFVASHPSGHRFIAHCYQEVPRVNLFDQLCQLNEADDALVMIGPEGDFSREEMALAVERGWQLISLGDSRLRIETAALTATAAVYLNCQLHPFALDVGRMP